MNEHPHASVPGPRSHLRHTVEIAIPAPRPAPGSPPSPLRPLSLSESCSGIALSTADTAISDLSDYELVEELDRTTVITASWYARRLKVIAQLYRRPVMHPSVPESAGPGRPRTSISREVLTVTEIAPALRISEDAARRLLNRALTLTSRLPGTLALLTAGRLDEHRAHAAADLIGKLADWAYAAVLEDDGSPRLAEHAATALATMVERRVLARAPHQRTDQFRDCVRRAIARVAPAFAATLIQASTAGRDVFVSHLGQDEQMGFLGAHLPIIEARACYAALDARARTLRDLGDLRTLDQLRADALVNAILNPGAITTATSADLTGDTDLASGTDLTSDTDSPSGTKRTGGAGGTGGTETATDSRPIKHVARGVAAHVQITVSLETLLKLRDDPAHLTGYGTITADVARALAAQPGSTWRRLITDPVNGTLLDYGRKTYRPPRPLADHVIARDVTCTHPGCTRPAEGCDLDHILPFPLGATCECNLHPRCRRHHRIKHESSWQVGVSTGAEDADSGVRDAEGTLVSTSVTGHTYKTYRPVLTEVTPTPALSLRNQAGSGMGPKSVATEANWATQSDDEPPF
jgi:hypothetical protein